MQKCLTALKLQVRAWVSWSDINVEHRPNSEAQKLLIIQIQANFNANNLVPAWWIMENEFIENNLNRL